MSWLAKAVNGIFLMIDQIVYAFVSFIYQVFFMVTEVNLFDTDGMGQITERIYVVFGIVMLFVFAYNILALIANPDKLSGKDNNTTKIIRDTVISLVVIALLPTIYDVMYQVQYRVLETNVIGNIVLGGTSVNNQKVEDSREALKNSGTIISTTIFSAFYHPVSKDGETEYSQADCQTNNDAPAVCETYLSAINDANASNNPSKFIESEQLKDKLYDGEMKYRFIVSTICGIIAIYLFASFTLDVGLRAVKLAVLQLVAPIPIMLRITKPSGGIFDKWFKEIKDTYISLFVRIAIIYFAIFTIDLVITYFTAGTLFQKYGVNMVSILAEVVLILSILAFAKEAPKLLKNIAGGAGNIEWNIKKKLNGENYEYGRRAAGAVGTIGRNLGREAFNFFNKRNEDGTYTRRPLEERGKQFRRTLRNLPSSVIYGGYSGWKNSGGNIENLGEEIKKSSVATSNRIDKKEAFRERAKENAIVGSIPGVGARLLTKANDLKAVIDAQGGVGNYLGNRINYTTSSVSAEKAGTFRKHHANIVDSELIQSGVKGIKEQAMREEEHIREYYNNQNLELLEKQRNLVGTDIDYQTFSTKAQNIENDKNVVRKSAPKDIKSIVEDKISFQSSYDYKKASFDFEAKELEAKRKAVVNDTTLTATARAEALKEIDNKILANTNEVSKLETQKINFETELQNRVNALSAENQSHYATIESRINEIRTKETDLYSTDIGQSEFGLQIHDIMLQKSINKQELASEIKRLGDEKKANIRDAYKKNLTDYSSDVRAYYVNNLKEIRSEFSEIPVSAQRIIFKEAGFKDAEDPNFNLVEALNEVGKIILDEDYTDENVDRLMGFFKGLKRVENRGPFDYRISRMQDATGAKKDGDKK